MNEEWVEQTMNEYGGSISDIWDVIDFLQNKIEMQEARQNALQVEMEQLRNENNLLKTYINFGFCIRGRVE